MVDLFESFRPKRGGRGIQQRELLPILTAFPVSPNNGNHIATKVCKKLVGCSANRKIYLPLWRKAGGDGVIGSRARLRIWWREPCGFESHSPHEKDEQRKLLVFFCEGESVRPPLQTSPSVGFGGLRKGFCDGRNPFL